MKQTNMIAKSVLSFLIIVLLLPACNMFKSDTDMIKERINKFVISYNSGDIEGVIDCLDSKKRTTYKSALGIGNALLNGLIDIDISLQDIFGIGMGLTENDSITIEKYNNINISSDSATVDISLIYTDEIDGDRSNEKGVFYLIKENDDWFISDLKDN
ncbi:MAG: hypothetical protein ACI4XI_03385 [Ruminococcus sp.]